MTMDTKDIQPLPKEPNMETTSKPNETGAISIQGHIKIFDPETKEVFLVQIKTKKGARKVVKKYEKIYENCTIKTWTDSWE